MAAIEPAAPKATGAKPRARKHSFRLDMTPMVDLAFLLLTFFMLTTTFAKPGVMQLTMPVKANSDQMTPVRASEAMTILLGRGREIGYYFGLNQPNQPAPVLHRTDFSGAGLRRALLRRQRQGPLVVLIKADKTTRYQSLVDVLDEMNITNQQKYALTELSAADRQLLAATGQR